MRTFETIGEWQDARQCHRSGGLTLGFVPTMGALHDGHLSLVARSRAENAQTLVSIFVNPTQFNDRVDLASYPRPLAQDLALLEGAGVDFVLVPAARQLYPDEYRYRVTETDRSLRLEGTHRPEHFDGVLTVVLKLLQIAGAERAYFGEKDWQQLALVKGLVEAFFVPTTIVACPTLRDEDGLAASSRNARLSPADRVKAAAFYQTLISAASAAEAEGTLQKEGFQVDYVEDVEQRRLGAVRLGGVRLIDNVPLARVDG